MRDTRIGSVNVNVGPEIAMRSAKLTKIIQDPLFRVGITLQSISIVLIGVTFLTIRLGWIDIVKIGLESGIDRPSPQLEALNWGFRGLLLAFASGFIFYAVAFYRQRNQQTVAPDDRPGTQAGDPRIEGGQQSAS